jgi:hypothetical protein
LEAIGYFHVTSAFVVSIAKRVDVPLLICAVRPLDMSPNNVFIDTVSGLTETGCLTAEFFPVFQP